jgi:hypothetical protein
MEGTFEVEKYGFDFCLCLYVDVFLFMVFVWDVLYVIY